VSDSKITLHGTNMRRADGSWQSWIESGLWGPAEHRGRNTLIPGKPGQAHRPKIAHERIVNMPTRLQAATYADLLDLDDELRILWEATQSQPRPLVVLGPLYGVAAGFKRTINVQWVNAVPVWLTDRLRVEWNAQYVSVDSPPDWVEAAV
jgi:hypothetical protein